MYTLKIADNNNVSFIDYLPNHRAAALERTKTIQAYGCTKKSGFTRRHIGDDMYFDHALYGTVVLSIYKTNQGPQT